MFAPSGPGGWVQPFQRVPHSNFPGGDLICPIPGDRSHRMPLPLSLSRPLVVLDLETTGLDIANDRIVEIGLVKLTPSGERLRFVERMDPGMDIPEASAKVHGIRTEDVRGLFGKPRLNKFADSILEFLGDADIAGFNSIAYDMPLFEEECRRHGIAFSMEDRHHVDAKIIFHAKELGWDRFLMGPRNLTAAVRHYCGRDLDGAHSAEYDAEGTLDVLLAQLELYDDLPREVAGLHEFCAQPAV